MAGLVLTIGSMVQADTISPPPPITKAVPVREQRFPFVAPPGGFPADAIVHEGPRTVLSVPGLQTYRTAGLSMIPIIPDGGLVLVAPVKPAEVRVGTVLLIDGCVFFSQGILYLHQVWRIDEDAQGWFALTRGIAGSVSDLCQVRADMLRGYVVAVLYVKAIQ